MQPPDFRVGEMQLDYTIDKPPYDLNNHVKVSVSVRVSVLVCVRVFVSISLHIFE